MSLAGSITDGISARLRETFGEGITIYTEAAAQGMTKPCFFILLLNSSRSQRIGKRYYQKNSFDLRYDPPENIAGSVAGLTGNTADLAEDGSDLTEHRSGVMPDVPDSTGNRSDLMQDMSGLVGNEVGLTRNAANSAEKAAMDTEAEQLFDALKFISAGGDILRGTNMHCEKKEGSLHFFVEYNMFLICEEPQSYMEEIEQQLGAKG